jgi:hypothetical protein
MTASSLLGVGEIGTALLPYISPTSAASIIQNTSAFMLSGGFVVFFHVPVDLISVSLVLTSSLRSGRRK